jgi:hypothetical protein
MQCAGRVVGLDLVMRNDHAPQIRRGQVLEVRGEGGLVLIRNQNGRALRLGTP